MRGKPFTVGERYGQLVITAVPETNKRSGHWVRHVEVLCDCGNKKLVQATNLRRTGSRATGSCGCRYFGRKPHRSLPIGEAAFRTLFRSYVGNAKNRGYSFDLDEERFRKLITDTCSYCGCAPEAVVNTRSGYGSFLYNGLDRVNNDLGYVEGNVVACCKLCNLAKKDLDLPVFLAWIARVHAHSVQRSDSENIMRITF